MATATASDCIMWEYLVCAAGLKQDASVGRHCSCFGQLQELHFCACTASSSRAVMTERVRSRQDPPPAQGAPGQHAGRHCGGWFRQHVRAVGLCFHTVHFAGPANTHAADNEPCTGMAGVPNLHKVPPGGAHGGVAVDGHAERERAVGLLAVRQVARQVLRHLTGANLRQPCVWPLLRLIAAHHRQHACTHNRFFWSFTHATGLLAVRQVGRHVLR
jgi:hypothetical protein